MAAACALHMNRKYLLESADWVFHIAGTDTIQHIPHGGHIACRKGNRRSWKSFILWHIQLREHSAAVENFSIEDQRPLQEVLYARHSDSFACNVCSSFSSETQHSQQLLHFRRYGITQIDRSIQFFVSARDIRSCPLSRSLSHTKNDKNAYSIGQQVELFSWNQTIRRWFCAGSFFHTSDAWEPIATEWSAIDVDAYRREIDRMRGTASVSLSGIKT